MTVQDAIIIPSMQHVNRLRPGDIPGIDDASSVLLALNYLIPVGAIGFESRALESLFYAVLMFSPILCAGLLFGSAIRDSKSVARDYGVNLLGAMAGGVAEYMSLVTGFRALLFVIAACYIAAVLARQADLRRRAATAAVGAL